MGRRLLVTGLFDPALVVMAIAFGSLVSLGAQGGAGPALVGALGALLTLLLTSVLVAVVEALVPPASQQRRAIGTIVVAVVISLVAVVGTLLTPTGWAADAVRSTMTGDVLGAVLPLAGSVLLLAALTLVWPAVLSRRLDGDLAATSRRRATRRRLLPGTPVGGVVSKELRMWARDPLRLTFLVIAAIICRSSSPGPESATCTAPTVWPCG